MLQGKFMKRENLQKPIDKSLKNTTEDPPVLMIHKAFTSQERPFWLQPKTRYRLCNIDFFLSFKNGAGAGSGAGLKTKIPVPDSEFCRSLQPFSTFFLLFESDSDPDRYTMLLNSNPIKCRIHKRILIIVIYKYRNLFRFRVTGQCCVSKFMLDLQ